MRRSGRRVFMAGLGAASLAALGGSCKADPRERALRGTVERVLVPDARAISQASDALQSALQRLGSGDASAGLELARGAWRAASSAWQRGCAFQHGPYVDTGALLRAAYWPVRTPAIAQLVLEAEPIDAARVAQLGVNVKGIYAIEHLLFESETKAAAAWVIGDRRERALALARAFAADVCAHAARASSRLGDGAAFGREFARDGQRSIDRLVNGQVVVLENAVIRMDRMLSLAKHGLSAREVLGGPSGTSTEIVTAWLQVSERVYGAGSTASLAGLVQAVAPAIHVNVTQAFAAAAAGLAQLGQPLERAAVADPARLSAAKQAVQQLEVSLRSELASALGITLSFSSRDGD